MQCFQKNCCKMEVNVPVPDMAPVGKSLQVHLNVIKTSSLYLMGLLYKMHGVWNRPSGVLSSSPLSSLCSMESSTVL